MVPELDQLRGEPQKLLDQVKQFEPTTLIGDTLSTPFQQLLQEMNAFKPGAARPREAAARPAQTGSRRTSTPPRRSRRSKPPFDELMAALDSLKPDAIVKPLQDG